MRNGNTISDAMFPVLPMARTRTESLRIQLEKDILEGRLVPGTKLDENEIASLYGVSRTPVREAFKALSSSGLIDIRQHYGAFVSILTLQRLSEMLEFMSTIETACAELAAERATETDKIHLLSAQEACVCAADENNADLFYDANVKFHETIYVAAHNEFISEQARQLKIRLEPYRRKITFDQKVMIESVTEHNLIMQAIFEGNTSESLLQMKQHAKSLTQDIKVLAKFLMI